MERFTIGVIISTYNNPKWLEKTLWGYMCQSRPADEIIVADDGSGPETKALIEAYRGKLPLSHVWHEDKGFRKTRILNVALLRSKADYLIFTDQDCVPRQDFIATHERYARCGRFLSGGYFRLPMDISQAITQADIQAGRAFSTRWLKEMGMKWSEKWLKLAKSQAFTRLMNHVTPARATWNGCNASGWRDDLLAVNGFNEEMRYGAEDRELGVRLNNLGIRPCQVRYSAIVLHLDHKRPYKHEEEMRKNRAIMMASKREKLIRTPYGLNLHEEENQRER